MEYTERKSQDILNSEGKEFRFSEQQKITNIKKKEREYIQDLKKLILGLLITKFYICSHFFSPGNF